MKKIIGIAGALALIIGLTSFTIASNKAASGDDLIGLWEPSNGKARVKIEKIGKKYYGKIVVLNLQFGYLIF